MLPLLHGDISDAARVLLMLAPDARRQMGARLVAEADQAADHVTRTGHLHPLFGNGSLMAAARRYPLADEPGFDDPEYCACMIEVLLAVSQHAAT